VNGSVTLFPTLVCIAVVLLTAVPRSSALDSTVFLSITPTLDLYTQRGGVGPNQPGGYFKLGEEVDFVSIVTYNGNPVQSKLVAFQLINPANQTLTTRTAITDQNGEATLSFIISNSLISLGTWVAISSVDVAKEVVLDTLTFQVTQAIPVGGFSISMKRSPTTIPLTPYYLTVLTAILTLVAIRRKAKRA
jgi:hypothetical protein